MMTVSCSNMLTKVLTALQNEPVLLSLVLKDQDLGEWWRKRKVKEAAKTSKTKEVDRLEIERARLAQVRLETLLAMDPDAKQAVLHLERYYQNSDNIRIFGALLTHWTVDQKKAFGFMKL